MKRPVLWGLVVPAVLRRLLPPWLLEKPLIVAARHPWIALAVAGAVLGMAGLLVAASGIVPVKASSGHWAITEAILQFSKRRSVSTHALGTSVPPLESPSLVLQGAGHYDLGCRPCHGTPRGDRPEVAVAMLPDPPRLSDQVPTWSEAELFQIVKHGLKFTGMPAWPSQRRDDEVWAMVAFLMRYPELSDSEYLRLARGEPDTTLALEPEKEPAPEVVVESCARCHGLEGTGRGAAFPKLAGQRAEYMSRALVAYADGRRHSGTMASVASGLTVETMRQAAQYYAGLAPSLVAVPDAPSAGVPPNADVARGREIATVGVPDRDVPACADCHGPGAIAETHSAYPRLDGQYFSYLSLQLRLLKERRRGGSEYVNLMHSFVDRLEEDDIRDAAAYFASLPPDTP